MTTIGALKIICVLGCLTWSASLASASNIALGKAVTASGVLAGCSAPGCLPEYAVDGNPATGWQDGYPDPIQGWLTVDLQDVHGIDKIVVTCCTTGFLGTSFLDYRLYASTDNTNWTLLTTRFFGNGYEVQTLSTPDLEARYIKYETFYNLRADPAWGRLNEIEIYSSDASAAPEPSSLALIFGGAGSIAARRVLRHKRR